MIHRAVAIYESLFKDPITIRIYFRYCSDTPRRTNFSLRCTFAELFRRLRGSVEHVHKRVESRCEDA